MKLTVEKIKSRAQDMMPYLQEVRRHIHANPELSFVEEKTSQYIKLQLEKHDIPFTEGWVKTGIVAIVKGGLPGTVRAFRAELDALPIEELNDHVFKSKNKGIMHACGHDVHATCLLGAAILLNEMKTELEGELHFIFQPGEEKLPGGASLMLEENIFQNSLPSSIVAQHVYPALPVGKFGICSGDYMASADEIYIDIIGKGGHAALPHLCIDPIVIASQVILSLQNLVSRYGNPIIPSVLTIGKINSQGGSTNVIPDVVKLEGTFRTMDESWRYKAHEIIREVVAHTVAVHGANAIVDIKVGYPVLSNDIELSKKIKEKMIAFIGIENVIDLPKRLSSEDFAFFAQKLPACFYRLGVANDSKGIHHGVHTPYFDVDESCLSLGTGMMAWLAF